MKVHEFFMMKVFGVNLGIDASVFPQTSHQVSLTSIFGPGLKPFRAGPK